MRLAPRSHDRVLPFLSTTPPSSWFCHRRPGPDLRLISTWTYNTIPRSTVGVSSFPSKETTLMATGPSRAMRPLWGDALPRFWHISCRLCTPADQDAVLAVRACKAGSGAAHTMAVKPRQFGRASPMRRWWWLPPARCSPARPSALMRGGRFRSDGPDGRPGRRPSSYRASKGGGKCASMMPAI